MNGRAMAKASAATAAMRRKSRIQFSSWTRRRVRLCAAITKRIAAHASGLCRRRFRMWMMSGTLASAAPHRRNGCRKPSKIPMALAAGARARGAPREVGREGHVERRRGGELHEVARELARGAREALDVLLELLLVGGADRVRVDQETPAALEPVEA